MEHIRDALTKARASLDENRDTGVQEHRVPEKRMPESAPVTPKIAKLAEARKDAPELRSIDLDPRILERNRIVARSMGDPNHVAFNMLRTRVRKLMRDNGWKSLAITSPTPGCGKTMVCLNLAFSMARTQGFRTVVVDLDLKRPAVAKTLGIQTTGSIGRFLEGEGTADECFANIDENLIVGLNADHLRNSSELIQGARIGELLGFISSLAPDIVLFDLPPMRTTDDALSFLPHADASLLVVAAGMTTVPEVDECEQQIAQLDKFVGIVMNKAEDAAKEYYYSY